MLKNASTRGSRQERGRVRERGSRGRMRGSSGAMQREIEGEGEALAKLRQLRLAYLSSRAASLRLAPPNNNWRPRSLHPGIRVGHEFEEDDVKSERIYKERGRSERAQSRSVAIKPDESKPRPVWLPSNATGTRETTCTHLFTELQPKRTTSPAPRPHDLGKCHPSLLHLIVTCRP
jgi:hypothetical protein